MLTKNKEEESINQKLMIKIKDKIRHPVTRKASMEIIKKKMGRKTSIDVKKNKMNRKPSVEIREITCKKRVNHKNINFAESQSVESYDDKFEQLYGSGLSHL